MSITAPRTRLAWNVAAPGWLTSSQLRRALWPAGVVVGLAAELTAGAAAPARVLADLATGWTLIACGLIVWDRRARNRIGPVMAIAGFAWFAGNFDDAAAYLHRGPLAHMVLAYPAGALTLGIGAVAGAWYVAAVIPPLAESDWLTITLGTVLITAALVRLMRATPAGRRDLALAAVSAAAMALPLIVGSVLRAAGAPGDFEDPVLTAYEFAIVGAGVLLTWGLLSRSDEKAAAVVVELGAASGSGAVRDALARALADRSLMVGYWVPASGAYVDEHGQPLALPATGDIDRVTVVADGGMPLAALVHEPGLLDDPDLVRQVSSALRLAVANARLQAEARERMAELRASRRRVLDQADAPRRLVERRLQTGTERHLVALEKALDRARATATPPAAEVLAEAAEELERTRVDLQELAHGLQPAALAGQGLHAALAELASHAPVPVDLDVVTPGLPARLEAAIYFVCSEALANVAKHAEATRAGLELSVADGCVRVAVWDDGRGGADPAAGSGLRGLAERVSTAGGRLRVESPPGAGTRLLAELHLSGQ